MAYLHYLDKKKGFHTILPLDPSHTAFSLVPAQGSPSQGSPWMGSSSPGFLTVMTSAATDRFWESCVVTPVHTPLLTQGSDQASPTTPCIPDAPHLQNSSNSAAGQWSKWKLRSWIHLGKQASAPLPLLLSHSPLLMAALSLATMLNVPLAINGYHMTLDFLVTSLPINGYHMTLDFLVTPLAFNVILWKPWLIEHNLSHTLSMHWTLFVIVSLHGPSVFLRGGICYGLALAHTMLGPFFPLSFHPFSSLSGSFGTLDTLGYYWIMDNIT